MLAGRDLSHVTNKLTSPWIRHAPRQHAVVFIKLVGEGKVVVLISVHHMHTYTTCVFDSVNVRCHHHHISKVTVEMSTQVPRQVWQRRYKVHPGCPGMIDVDHSPQLATPNPHSALRLQRATTSVWLSTDTIKR